MAAELIGVAPRRPLPDETRHHDHRRRLRHRLRRRHPASIGREFVPNTHPIAFHVEDVEATRAELESKGVKFLAETIDSGVCHVVPFADPDGNVLMIHNRYAPRE